MLNKRAFVRGILGELGECVWVNLFIGYIMGWHLFEATVILGQNMKVNW